MRRLLQNDKRLARKQAPEEKDSVPAGSERKVSKWNPEDVNKTVPEASAKVTKLPPKCYTEVVANLKKRGRAKPGTVPALKNSIFTSFPKLSPDQIDVLVQELKSGGEISVKGSKVMYL